MPRKRKPFHVYRRTNGVYYVRIPDKTCANGYRHESLGATTVRQAYKIAEAMTSKEVNGGQRTFAEAAQEFALKHFPTLTAKSAQRYSSSYNNVQTHLGALALDDIGTGQDLGFRRSSTGAAAEAHGAHHSPGSDVRVIGIQQVR